MTFRIFWSFLFASLFFLGLNYYTRKKLPESFAVPLSYDQLYTNDSTFHLKDISQVGDSVLNVQFGGTGHFLENIEVVDEFGKLVSRNQNQLQFQARDGIKTYFIREKFSKVLIDSFEINYTSAAEYAGQGHRSSADFELLGTTIPFVGFRIVPKEIWAQPFDQIPQSKNEPDPKTFLSDTLRVSATDSTLEKLKKNLSYLFVATDGHRGVPADSLAGLNPYDFLQAVRSNKTKLWCGDYTGIFSWLCYLEKIDTRVVGISSLHQVSFGNHTVAEVFVPEWQKWILCDPTNHIGYIRRGKNYFNTVDLFQYVKSGSTDSSVICGFFAGPEFYEKPLVNINQEYRHFYNRNSRIRYYFAAYLRTQNDPSLLTRFSNFMFPRPNSSWYAGSGADIRTPFYARKITAELLAFCLLGMLVTGIIAILPNRKWKSSAKR